MSCHFHSEPQSLRGPSFLDSTMAKTSLDHQIERIYFVLRDGVKEEIAACLDALLQVSDGALRGEGF